MGSTERYAYPPRPSSYPMETRHMLEGSKQKGRGRGQYLAAFCFVLGLGGVFLLSASAVQQAAQASPLPPAAPRGTASPTETPPPACQLAWRLSSSANTGPEDNVFNAVAAVSANDVWVVGYYSVGNLALALTMHWD